MQRTLASLLSIDEVRALVISPLPLCSVLALNCVLPSLTCFADRKCSWMNARKLRWEAWSSVFTCATTTPSLLAFFTDELAIVPAWQTPFAWFIGTLDAFSVNNTWLAEHSMQQFVLDNKMITKYYCNICSYGRHNSHAIEALWLRIFTASHRQVSTRMLIQRLAQTIGSKYDERDAIFAIRWLKDRAELNSIDYINEGEIYLWALESGSMYTLETLYNDIPWRDYSEINNDDVIGAIELRAHSLTLDLIHFIHQRHNLPANNDQRHLLLKLTMSETFSCDLSWLSTIDDCDEAMPRHYVVNTIVSVCLDNDDRDDVELIFHLPEIMHRLPDAQWPSDDAVVALLGHRQFRRGPDHYEVCAVAAAAAVSSQLCGRLVDEFANVPGDDRTTMTREQMHEQIEYYRFSP